MPQPPDPEHIKNHLAVRIVALAREIAPDGRMHGREWQGHAADGAKYCIVCYGPKTGHWQNVHNGDAGRSALSLIRDAWCGGDHKAAWRRALQWLGEETTARPAPPRPSEVPAVATERHAGAVTMFLRGVPFSWDGPAGQYLQARGIDAGKFRPFGALRYAAEQWHDETASRMPAMLAAVVNPRTSAHIATHRTYLERRGGIWRKAQVRASKMLIGAARGGVVPLTKGASGKPLRQAPIGDAALLGEGIENTLSVAQAELERRALAYVSAGNLIALDLPPQLEFIRLVCDRDGENLAIEDARQWTITHWEDEGRKVDKVRPPPGVKDANDWLMGELERV